MAGRGDPGSAAVLDVLVTPRASAESVGPFQEGLLHVRVTRPPADGQANRAVGRLLATTFGLPIGRVVLLTGARSRRKRFRLEGIAAAELARRLARLAD